MKKSLYVALSCAVLGLASCNSTEEVTNNAHTAISNKLAMGNGTVNTFVKVDANSIPTEVGITLSDQALVGLPNDSLGSMWVIPFPAAERAKTPFDHVMINWNPYGHPPQHVYDKPHFDFHFYTIDSMTQMMIQGGPDMTATDSTLYPAGYVTDYGSVPMMGVHYVPLTDMVTPNFNFQSTMVYGFTKGNFAFLEPMITKAFIEGQNSVSYDIPQPIRFAYPGKYFPTKYSIVKDASAKTYTISYSNFIKR